MHNTGGVPQNLGDYSIGTRWQTDDRGSPSLMDNVIKPRRDLLYRIPGFSAEGSTSSVYREQKVAASRGKRTRHLMFSTLPWVISVDCNVSQYVPGFLPA